MAPCRSASGPLLPQGSLPNQVVPIPFRPRPKPGAFCVQPLPGLYQLADDACIEVFGDDRVLKVQYDTPYVRNLPITLHFTAANGKGGVIEQTVHPAWGDGFAAEWQR